MVTGNSLAVQWLGLCTLTAEGPGEGLGSIPGQGTKIPQAAWHGQKTKEGGQKKKRKQTYGYQRGREEGGIN